MFNQLSSEQTVSCQILHGILYDISLVRDQEKLEVVTLGSELLIHHCIQFRARVKWPKGWEYYSNTIIIRLAQYRSVSRKIKFDPV